MLPRFTLRDFLGVALVTGFMAVLGLLFAVAVPEANEKVVIYMVGQLSGFVSAVVAYHYTMNALNAKATANTGDAFKALIAQAEAQSRTDGSTAPPPDPEPGQEKEP